MDSKTLSEVVQEKEQTEKYGKNSNLQTIKEQISKINLVVKRLESTLAESEQNDKQLVMALRVDNMKNQRLSSQLEEARKENKQILNALQQQCSEKKISRSCRSQVEISSCSTISMVHLQYKYEELLSSHEGLLKVLESRVKEIQKAYSENSSMRDEIENLNAKLINYEKQLQELNEKYWSLKKRKDVKIRCLRNERNTLRLVHNQLVELLSKQCVEQDKFLLEQLQRTKEPIKALLLNEVRKTNQLQHENAQLKQQVEYLKSNLNFIESENHRRDTIEEKSKDSIFK